MDKQRLLNFVLIFLIAFLVLQLFTRPEMEKKGPQNDLEIGAEDEFTLGQAVTLKLKNNTSEKIEFAAHCPAAPFTLQRYENGEFLTLTATAQECEEVPAILPGELRQVSYQPFQGEILQQPGRYRIEIPVAEKKFFHEFEIEAPGVFGQIWQTLIYRPIFNALIFFTDLTSGSLGWGIILLTVALRLLLFIPFQKSLQSQRKLQRIQPEIEQIKKRFKGNQKMVAFETMALMKKHKVSPLGSCLPLLLQIPFLLAVFWVTYDGLGPNTLVYFYESLRGFDFALLTTNFLGLDLTVAGSQFYCVLPLLLAVLQFGQMKLAMHHTQAKKPEGNPFQEALHSMSKLMPYFLPVMIGFFSATMPAAVGIYWGASTVFGIGQQLIVNRQIK